MSPYEKAIDQRIDPLTKEGKLLYQLTKGASEQIYDVAKKYSESKFETDIVNNSYGYDLTNQANEFFFQLARNCDAANARQVSNGKGHRYTIVKVNNIIFTISKVQTHREMVRESIFRNDYVEDMNPTLFSPHPTLISNTDSIYAVITHGPISNRDRRIGFLNVGVIDDAYNDYVYFRDLYKKCSIKRTYTDVSVERKEQKTSKEEPQVSLKRSS